MNPLSAIRTISVPSLAPDSVDSVFRKGAAKLETSPIPAPELRELPGITFPPTGEASSSSSSSFGNLFGRLVQEVSDKQTVAGEAVSGLVSGKNIPLHRAMIAMEEANVSFQLMVEVRNKLLESYQELMRMQI